MTDSGSFIYTVSEIKPGPSTVPAFLTKLWSLVSNSESDELIYWSENGTSFHVHDSARFAKEVLPFYFKHNNMASFVRQLNMYGFRKVVNVEHGSLKFQSDDLEFYHPYFCRGHEDLLIYIKRKGSSSSVKFDEKSSSQDGVEGVLSNCKRLQERQDKVDAQLISLKRENEALWNEVAVLRQKHAKQQQVVNKLVQFLVSLVQSGGRSVSMKRKTPLAIKGRQRKYAKTERKLLSDSKEPSSEGVIISDVLQDSDSDNLETVTGQAGMSPEMLEELSHEPLDLEELLHEMPLKPVESENNEPANTGKTDTATSPIVTSPLSDLGQQGVEPGIIQGEDVPIYPVLLPTTTTIAVPVDNFAKSELQEKVEATSNDLDSLKRLLSNGSYNFDASEFLGVSNPLTDYGAFPSTSSDDASILESILSYLQDESNEQEQLPLKPSSLAHPGSSTTGKELVQFISPTEMGLPDAMLFDSETVLEVPEHAEGASTPSSALNTPAIDKSLL